ncbi:MAG: PAS domain S-box protein [Gemmatimonadota bacterium]|nr:MAG: PAS domain S-box protein [Gemmatimonadota bacterium]
MKAIDENMDLENLPYSFKELDRYRTREATTKGVITEGIGIYVNDIDNDMRDEFLLSRMWDYNKYTLEYYDEERQRNRWVYTTTRVIQSILAVNLNLTGDLEIIIAEKDTNCIYLKVLSSEEDSIQFFKAVEGSDLDGSGFWDGNIYLVTGYDVNNDGFKDIITRVTTGYDERPRGIYVFDVTKGETLWEFRMGPCPLEILLTDVDGDRVPEIICSSAGCNNGNKDNGTVDSLSYIFVLNLHGELLWRVRTGAESSYCCVAVGDIDGDSLTEVVTASYSESANVRKPNDIKIRTGSNGHIERAYHLFTHFTSLHVSDLNDDRKMELIATTTDSGVLQFSPELEIIHAFNYPLDTSVLLIDDINSDLKEEIFISTADNRTLVLNPELKLMAKFDDTWQLASMRTGYGQTKKILLLTRNFLYQLSLKKVLLPPIPWNYLLGGFIVGCVFFAIIIFTVSRRMAFNPFQYDQDRFFDGISTGLFLIDRKDTITFVTKRAREILGLHMLNIKGQNYQEVLQHVGQQEILKFIEKSKKRFGGGSQELRLTCGDDVKDVLISITSLVDKRNRDRGKFITIEDITKFVQSKRAIEWAAMAQRLAHEIKNLLSTVMLTLQRLQMEYQRKAKEEISIYDKYAESILEEVTRLRTISDGFMKFASLKPPNLQPTNINEVAKKTLGKYIQGIPDNVNLKSVYAEDVSDSFADEEQIQTVLTNLLDNGVNAMPDGGTLTISTHFVQKLPEDGVGQVQNCVVIEIADTGIGINQENVDKLFEPFFSLTEGGTGLGLAIVKKIVDDHRGTIEIKSREGIGTTVSVELPV